MNGEEIEDREVSVHCAPIGGHMPDNGLNVIVQMSVKRKEKKMNGNGERNQGKLHLVMV